MCGENRFSVCSIFFSLHDANTHMASSFALFYRRAIRQSAEVVNQMVCVERVSEYSQLESEADLQTETDEDVPFWPFSGTIQVQNLSIRYRKKLPLSLKGVTFDIPCGKCIGVVGRTGSGE